MASIAKRPDGRYRARYADPSGKQHARHFERKVDASAWLDKIRGELAEHRYVDPAAGRITFKEYAERWRGAQVHAPSTVAQIESRCRLHFYPTFGDRELASIRKSDVQAWVKGRAKVLAPGSVSVMFRWFSTILRAACDDGLIRATPCRGVKLPRAQRVEVVPLATDEVEALLAAVGPQWQAAVMLAAGAGLRYGEVAGLTLDRVDFLRRSVRVDRQLVSLAHQRPHLAPPKTEASVRTIPLPQVVVDALAAHLAAYPAGPDGFVFTDGGRPVPRNRFSSVAWLPAVAAAGLEDGARFHDLRHYYASLLIRHGESVKVVQARLGHASAAETLDTYSHLWPDSEDETRAAVDGVLGAPASPGRERSPESRGLNGD